MGNVVVPNFNPGSFAFKDAGTITNARSIVWKLTRALKAAGWNYKSSGNGNTGAGAIKDTTGAYASDAWNGYGLPISGQSGSAANITAVTTGVATVTGLTGMTANDVGRVLELRGAFVSTNNGFFKIVTFTNSTTVGVLGPTTSAESHNGAIQWIEYDKTYTTQSGTAASITTFENNRVVTVTGLTGITPLTTQRWLNISGANSAGNNGTFKILSWISSSSVTIINAAGVAPDGYNGTISWSELDPLQEQYINFTANNWINLQGPSTLSFPITVQSTGTFTRGETVTQNSTGASGEILGYQYDTVASAGRVVVMPQINGNGAGVQGWSTGSLSGNSSGATVTPSATPIEFIREMVIFMNGASNMLSSFQCVDSVGESASRFSTLAAAAGCTASVPPGGGGTGNAFPAPGSYTFCGDSTTPPGTVTNFSNASIVGFNNTQIMCVDATYDGYRSADGSWACVSSVFPSGATTAGSSSTCIGYVFTRVDNQEDGDVDPYVMYCPQATALYAATRQAATATFASPEYFTAASTPQFGSNMWNLHQFRGWRRRGFASTDAFQGFGGALICGIVSASGSYNANATSTLGINVLTTNAFDGPRMATRNNTPTSEPLWVVSAQSGSQKMRKGTCRWMRLVMEGSLFDLYYGGTWVQASNSYPAVIVGMWDGISTPKR